MARRKARKSAYIPPQSETVNRRQRSPTTRTAAGGSRGSRTSNARVAQPPSWKRVFRQVPIYYVLIAGVNFVLTPGHDKAGHVLHTAARLRLSLGSSLLVVLAFVPLMYFLDRRRWERDNPGAARAAKSSKSDRETDMVAR